MLAGMDSFPHFPLAIPGTIVVFSYEGFTSNYIILEGKAIKFNSLKTFSGGEGRMESKLFRQFIFFMVVLFAWTVFALVVFGK